MSTAEMNVKVINGVNEVSSLDLASFYQGKKLIDVRRPEEFTGELGHIPGSHLVTLGPELVQFLEKANKDEEVIFICRSGARSREACLISQKLGFKNPINLQGGMIGWNELKLPIEK